MHTHHARCLTRGKSSVRAHYHARLFPAGRPRRRDARDACARDRRDRRPCMADRPARELSCKLRGARPPSTRSAPPRPRPLPRLHSPRPPSVHAPHRRCLRSPARLAPRWCSRSRTAGVHRSHLRERAKRSASGSRCSNGASRARSTRTATPATKSPSPSPTWAGSRQHMSSIRLMCRCRSASRRRTQASRTSRSLRRSSITRTITPPPRARRRVCVMPTTRCTPSTPTSSRRSPRCGCTWPRERRRRMGRTARG